MSWLSSNYSNLLMTILLWLSLKQKQKLILKERNDKILIKTSQTQQSQVKNLTELIKFLVDTFYGGFILNTENLVT